jgi:hypothetical protein
MLGRVVTGLETGPHRFDNTAIERGNIGLQCSRERGRHARVGAVQVPALLDAATKTGNQRVVRQINTEQHQMDEKC